METLIAISHYVILAIGSLWSIFLAISFAPGAPPRLRLFAQGVSLSLALVRESLRPRKDLTLSPGTPQGTALLWIRNDSEHSPSGVHSGGDISVIGNRASTLPSQRPVHLIAVDERAGVSLVEVPLDRVSVTE